MTETAQDTYRRLVRDYLAPAFRELGFRGSGNHYWLPDDKNWIGLALQGSRWSDAERVLFTIDMSIVSKENWSKIRSEWLGPLPERPTPNQIIPPGLSWRIGAVLEPGETWWLVRSGQLLDSLAGEISWIVREGALPWLRSHVKDPKFYVKVSEGKAQAPSLRPKLGRFPTDLVR